MGGDDDPYARLVTAIAERGDRAAFRHLFEHYAPRVKGYLIRLGLDAARSEELAQEVLVTVWRKAASFDPAKASVSTWIFRIARNRRIDVFRRDRTAVLDVDDPALAPPEAPDPSDGVAAGQQRKRITAALGDLPEDQRDLVRRAFYDDLSHSEIAEATGLALGTVKSRLRLAFAKLRAALGDAT
ncbi:MAG: sigma-70 family RNA polymerase sigma factor [Caulobacter sp.]|nr:sigma-70 family RNA polymerase sigma factor [Caulobacter sp.]